MPTLYVESVPVEIYQALRARARSNRRSISAETISILEQMVPSRSELRRRAAFCEKVEQIRGMSRRVAAGPSTEELLREDRNR